MAERQGFLQRGRIAVAAGALALAAFATACSGGGSDEGASQPSKPAVTVHMTDQLQFTPDKVTVHVGDTVVWRNSSQLVHTVTADPAQAADEKDVQLPDGANPFDSGNLSPDAEFRHTFTVPGHYRYFCIPHEAAGMVGGVEVKPK